MKDEKNFLELIEIHIGNVQEGMSILTTEMVHRANVHDIDKIFNKDIFDTYNNHYHILKTYTFGTPEYMEYEKKHFPKAHALHGKQRHHFYTEVNEVDDINLIDLIEAIVDIDVSVKQYNEGVSAKDVTEAIKSRGICDLDLESLIENTLKMIEDKKRDK